MPKNAYNPRTIANEDTVAVRSANTVSDHSQTLPEGTRSVTWTDSGNTSITHQITTVINPWITKGEEPKTNKNPNTKTEDEYFIDITVCSTTHRRTEIDRKPPTPDPSPPRNTYTRDYAHAVQRPTSL